MLIMKYYEKKLEILQKKLDRSEKKNTLSSINSSFSISLHPSLVHLTQRGREGYENANFPDEKDP